MTMWRLALVYAVVLLTYVAVSLWWMERNYKAFCKSVAEIRAKRDPQETP